ncbi:transporter [Flavobacterium sp. DG1-102-2]|uniref:transporter n=1 Tax=Flavobacterium sp. DG1-102-2 TaxID=3081663 RepID=UPI0029494A2D|nr:transporter [Flavobacterium sp. DG1-102-2]MDV6168185.1 transporter [Flavobacterium sp. DG1-102-2]
MKNLYAIVLIVTSFWAASAQDEIDTDRPDQTETPSIVPAKRFQMENGFVHQQNAKSESELALPTSLWKFGVSKNVELRVDTDLIYNKSHDSTSTGLSPITAGIKVKLWEEKGFIPMTSLITQVLLPKVASGQLQVKYLAPELRLLFQNSITDDIDLGYNVGMKWDGESTDPTYEYTLSPNISITDKLKAYIEIYGFMPQQKHPEEWFDGGLMFLITKNVQVDISAGYEISALHKHHQYFESIGFSFRI